MMALSFARKEVVCVRGVIYAAGSIAAATGLGAVLGWRLTNLQPKTYRMILSIAAGVMLCAAVQGLLLPALEETAPVWACAGMGAGTVFLVWMNTAAAKLLRLERDAAQLQGMMFVLAIAIHHLPEGLAAGVSFGTGEAAETAAVCAAIALQNIPEAMMIMPVMVEYGRGKAIIAVSVSGCVEILGLLLGYGAVQLTVRLLPLLLSFAAGAMLYVIFENMLPDAYENGRGRTAAGVQLGYCGMLLLTAGVEWVL